MPEEVAITNLRPDMLLISDSSKKMGIVELTVPGEERIEVSGELKRTKQVLRRAAEETAPYGKVSILRIILYMKFVEIENKIH